MPTDFIEIETDAGYTKLINTEFIVQVTLDHALDHVCILMGDGSIIKCDSEYWDDIRSALLVGI